MESGKIRNIDQLDRSDAVSLKSAEKPTFQTRFREGLPQFPISTFQTGFWKRRLMGIVELPNGVEIEYRRKRLNKLLYLRIVGPGCQWNCIEVSKIRSNRKARSLVCPYCTSAVQLIYAVNGSRGGWRCDKCILLPSGKPNETSRRLFNQLKRGNLQPVASALSDSRPQVIVNGMIAMQMAGLRPRQLTVAKPTVKVRRLHRLKVRSHGRLIFVGGRLYVR